MRNGELELITAKATIFATGGAGRMYLKTTNGYASTADGMGIAYRAGHPADGHGVHAVPSRPRSKKTAC